MPLRLTALTVTPARPRAGFARVTLGFTLSAASRVRITVERRVRNRRTGRVRFAKVRGTVTTAGKAGVNAFRWNGRVGGRKLGAGTYRLTAAAGTAKTTRTFTIAPARRRAR